MPIEPWGKLDRSHPDRTTAPRLSLVAHCIDVAAVTRALLELPTWRRRLERLAGVPFTATELDRLTVLAFWHDVGKSGAGFYAKALAPEQVPPALRDRWPDSPAGHTQVVAPLLDGGGEYLPHRQALGVEALFKWAGPRPAATMAMLNLWMASVSHHGSPLSAESLMRKAGRWATWLQPVAGYEPLHGLRRLGEAACALWPRAFEDPALSRTPTEPLIHAFAGLVSLADWIGSNTDDGYFPYGLGAAQDEGRWPVALARARQVLQRMRIDVGGLRKDLRQRSPAFGALFPFPPSDVQLQAGRTDLAPLVVLEAETGSGKTEAALWRFKCLFEAGEVDALCFLLPTRVAATAIHQRLQGFMDALFPDPLQRPNVVLAVPGYLRANGVDGARLPGFRVLWGDADDQAPMFWAAENSKRYFASAATAGTVDQFLLSAMRTRHAHLRATVLLRSLVVVDEVHASDRYMRTLLIAALERHLGAGGHALLLSATLASDMRAELMRAAPRSARRFGLSAPREVDPSQVAAATLDDYPRITSPGHAPWIGRAERHKRIQAECRPWMRDPSAVAARAAEAVAAGARVLVLRNTVRQAVATQRAVELLLGADHAALFRCAGVVALHHGRYAFADRRALDAEVQARFGKDAAKDRRPCLLVATQTIEISVDCDADLLITDLAPMDVLLQRMGRLHRHRHRDGYRPPACAEACCVVLTPDSADLAPLLDRGRTRGLGIGDTRSAYPDLVGLQATWDALCDPDFQPLCIPQHNRALVERTCVVEALGALARRLGSAWVAHLSELQGARAAQGGQADLSSLRWSDAWAEAVECEMEMPVRTRLGLDSIEVALPVGGACSPFGHRLTELSLPAWMLPPRAAEAMQPPELQAFEQQADGFHFELGSRGFVYDRFGLARADVDASGLPLS